MSKKIFDSFVLIVVGVLVVVGSVQAATTISENISTGGTLSVTGTSTLMGNVGIGTTTPSDSLVVDGDAVITNGFLIYPNSDYGITDKAMSFGFLSQSPFIESAGMGWVDILDNSIKNALVSDGSASFANGLVYITSDGNVGLGTTSPVEKLVVDGNLTVTGTTNGVKVYRALISQSGFEAAPTATVLENTLGVSIGWNYVDVGVYVMESDEGIFLQNKTFYIVNSTVNAADSNSIKLTRVNDNSFQIESIAGGTYADSQLLYTPIEILVYP